MKNYQNKIPCSLSNLGVPVSILERDTDYPQDFRGFPQSTTKNSGVADSDMTDSFQILSHSSAILTFNSTQPSTANSSELHVCSYKHNCLKRQHYYKQACSYVHAISGSFLEHDKNSVTLWGKKLDLNLNPRT